MGEKSWKIPLWLVKSQWDPRRQQNVNGSPLVWNACAGRHICHKHPTFPRQLGSLADVGSNGSTPCFKNTWCLGTITISDPSTFLGLNMSLKSKPQNSDIKNLGSSEILVRLDAFSVKIGAAHPIPSRHKWWHSSAPRIPLTPHAIRPPRRSPRMTKSGENRHAKPWFLRGILWWDRVMGWFWDDLGMLYLGSSWDIMGWFWGGRFSLRWGVSQQAMSAGAVFWMIARFMHVDSPEMSSVRTPSIVFWYLLVESSLW
jgi:hypothetical protein